MDQKNIRGPRTHRELRIYSAGSAAGSRNAFMAMAASKSRPASERAEFVRQARSFHHIYLARLREANGAVGYFIPEVVDTPPNYSLPPIEDGFMFRRQAGAK